MDKIYIKKSVWVVNLRVERKKFGLYTSVKAIKP